MPRHPFLHGTYTIAPTPFLPTGELDRASLATMVDMLVGLGVQGITMLGVMGEVDKLGDAERDVIIDDVITAAAGRVKICIGTSHVATDRCVALSNATTGMLTTLLDANGIAPHLDAIISVHEVRRYKPHPDADHFLAQHCQTRRDNCWLVSRHSWDVLGAIHAGLHGIWVRPDGTPNEPWEFAPDVSLPDFPTLVDYARINIR